jgi:hypothetical protein
MKLLKSGTALMRNIDNKVLTIRPDTYIEPVPEIFMVEIAVEANQTITLPTPNITQSTTNILFDFHDSLTGALLQTSSVTTSPSMTRSTLLANTEYYVKVRGNNNTVEGFFNFQVTGNGTAIPTTETGITSVVVGTPVPTNYLYYAGFKWFKFKTTAAGSYVINANAASPTYPAYNYNVNWDYINNTIPSVNGITTWNSASASYTYQFAGTYIIAITGSMPGWSVNNAGNMRLLITKCISWGDVGLKIIDWYGCTAMTTLPVQTDKLQGVLRFTNFCRDCTSLVSIPYGLFFGNSNVALFNYAFYNCISLRSIPATTFRDNVWAKSFDATFYLCNKITTLPSKLFEFCYNAITWYNCFAFCTSLTSPPVDLFYRAMMDVDYSKIAVASFAYTFNACSAITSIPTGFFSSTQADNLGLNMVKSSSFQACFWRCTALASIPEYMFHNQIYCLNAQWALNLCTPLTVIPRSCFEGCTALQNVGGATYYSGSYYGVFGQNANLLTIEQDCFKDCIACTDFSYMCYACPKLVSVGTNIFDNCIASTTYAFIFYNCALFTTPCANIFDDSPNVVSFSNTFAYTKVHSDSVPDVYQLHPEIFKYNTKVTDFSSVFSFNTNIVTIPEFIFSTCTEVTTFYNTFASCSNLLVIPPLLFRTNYKCQGFGQTFMNCTSITRIPVITENSVDYGLFYFNPQVRNFCNTFYNCRLTDGVDYFAIPQITFYGNTEVTGIYSGYPYDTVNSFYGTFQNNITLQSIPDYLFLYNSKAMDFSYTFAGCTNVNLTSLPSHLFKGTTNVDRFNYTFQNVKITSIPAILFEDCVGVKSFSYTFSGTNIVSIPSGLFGTATTGPKGAANSFTYTFYNCTLLTTIATDLFYYNINATTFGYCFGLCTSLVTVPSTLFKLGPDPTNSVTNDFNNVFNTCSKLKDIGTNLFRTNVGALNFTYAFYLCNKLKYDPTVFYEPSEITTRFLNKAMNFSYCFYKTGFDALDLYMGYSLTYNGSLVTSDDNAAGNYQPQLSRSLLANTDYYIRLYVVGSVDSGAFDILVTGGTGPGTPTPETDCTLLSIGTTLVGETISGANIKWYKFRTTVAGTYVFKTIQNATEITDRQSAAPDLWNCSFNYTPTKTQCWGTAAGNNAISINNYANIPVDWR